MAENLKWYGDKVIARLRKAQRYGVNRTMAEAVALAKHDHRGWQNKTGTAERSIRIALVAKTSPDGQTIGFWGSLAVAYFWFLEFGTKAHKIARAFGWRHLVVDHPGTKAYGTLQASAKRVYPRLAENIRIGWRSA